MVKRKALLGGFIGALIGVGLFVLAIYLGGVLIAQAWSFIVFSILAWLLGGFVAGMIATSPQKGALAGFLVSVFTFVITSLVLVFIVVFGGIALFATLFAVFTLGQGGDLEISGALIIVLVLIGILVSFIFSLISAVFNVSAGAIGGLIRNPNKIT